MESFGFSLSFRWICSFLWYSVLEVRFFNARGMISVLYALGRISAFSVADTPDPFLRDRPTEFG